MRKTSSYQTVSAETLSYGDFTTNRMRRIHGELASNRLHSIARKYAVGPVESCHSLMTMTWLQKCLGILVFYLRQPQMQLYIAIPARPIIRSSQSSLTSVSRKAGGSDVLPSPRLTCQVVARHIPAFSGT